MIQSEDESLQGQPRQKEKSGDALRTSETHPEPDQVAIAWPERGQG